MLTWGEIKAAMISEGVADTDVVYIGVTVTGGTSTSQLMGFIVVGTIMHKPVEQVKSGVVS